MEEAILEEAVRVVDRQDRSVELLMEDLQKTRLKLDADARRVAVLREEAEAAARVQKDLAERLTGTEQETRKTVRKKLTDELLRARAEVQSIIEGLKTDKRLLKAREAKEGLASIEHMLQARLAPAGDYRPVTALRAGDRVEVKTLGTVGVLLEDPVGKKRVRIRMGETEVSVPVANLGGLADGGREDAMSGPKAGQKPRPPALRSTDEADAPTVLDVRGKTADEALDALLACLDQAALAEVPLVRVIHGHGTGRLKQALRDYLKTSPYVAAFRSGEQGEGGDGVTMVNLR
jgi:DNA mismatch repair protein MutS2